MLVNFSYAKRKQKRFAVITPFDSVFKKKILRFFLFNIRYFLPVTPQWGAADAEIKVPFGENT